MQGKYPVYINYIFFFLSVSFPGTRREVPSLRGDRGKLAYTGQNTFAFLRNRRTNTVVSRETFLYRS